MARRRDDDPGGYSAYTGKTAAQVIRRRVVDYVTEHPRCDPVEAIEHGVGKNGDVEMNPAEQEQALEQWKRKQAKAVFKEDYQPSMPEVKPGTVFTEKDDRLYFAESEAADRKVVLNCPILKGKDFVDQAVTVKQRTPDDAQLHYDHVVRKTAKMLVGADKEKFKADASINKGCPPQRSMYDFDAEFGPDGDPHPTVPPRKRKKTKA